MTDYLAASVLWSVLWFTSGVGSGYLLRTLQYRIKRETPNDDT